MDRRAGLFVFALSAVLSPLARPQSLMRGYFGDGVEQRFGALVRPAGDVNGDGTPDHFSVSQPPLPVDSSATLHSGLDGSVLRSFGGAVNLRVVRGTGIGDVDLDGVADYAVAFEDSAAGAPSEWVDVFSGSTGGILWTFAGETGLEAATSVGPAGDVNGDGVPDVSIGAALADTAGTNAGRVSIVSGVDGSPLHTFLGDEAGAQIGRWNLDPEIGDVNGDGLDDVLISTSELANANGGIGYLEVFSGLDASLLYRIDGPGGNSRFGATFSGLGDVDGDGAGDFVMGADEGQFFGAATSRSLVYSGATGSLLYSYASPEYGRRLRNVGRAGDVDGDGVPDILVGDELSNGYEFFSGRLFVYSGANGSQIYSIGGRRSNDLFSNPAAGVGDVDGDGLGDLLVSARNSSENGFQSGSAWLFSSQLGADCNGNGESDALDVAFGGASDFDGDLIPDECEVIGVRYCSPNTANSTGLPAAVEAYGSAVAGDQDLFLRASSLPTYSFGYFLTSRQQGQVLFPGGSLGVLCLGGSIGRFITQIQNSGAAGEMAITVDTSSMPVTPNVQVAAGESWNFQLWYRDVQFFPVSNFSDAVSVTFQ